MDIRKGRAIQQRRWKNRLLSKRASVTYLLLIVKLSNSGKRSGFEKSFFIFPTTTPFADCIAIGSTTSCVRRCCSLPQILPCPVSDDVVHCLRYYHVLCPTMLFIASDTITSCVRRCCSLPQILPRPVSDYVVHCL